MYVWTQLRGRPCEASPLLRHLAGEFADRIAQLWPAPHTPFIGAATGQRHLVCLGLAGGKPHGDIVRAIGLPLKRALRLLLPRSPDGLLRALSRLGESAWTAADYGRLLELLRRPDTGKLLRHAEVIDIELVQSLAQFPPELLCLSGSGVKLGAGQSALVVEIWQAIRRRDGDRAAARLTYGLTQAKSPAALFDRLREALEPQLPPPPFEGTARLRPLRTREAMHDAARRYGNCLRGHVFNAASGRSAYYEWLGPPSAVVQIDRDELVGWRLEEARLNENQLMPLADRDALLRDLEAMGVHLGRGYWQLERQTWAAAQADYVLPPLSETLAEAFGH